LKNTFPYSSPYSQGWFRNFISLFCQVSPRSRLQRAGKINARIGLPDVEMGALTSSYAVDGMGSSWRPELSRSSVNSSRDESSSGIGATSARLPALDPDRFAFHPLAASHRYHGAEKSESHALRPNVLSGKDEAGLARAWQIKQVDKREMERRETKFREIRRQLQQGMEGSTQKKQPTPAPPFAGPSTTKDNGPSVTLPLHSPAFTTRPSSLAYSPAHSPGPVVAPLSISETNLNTNTHADQHYEHHHACTPPADSHATALPTMPSQQQQAISPRDDAVHEQEKDGAMQTNTAEPLVAADAQTAGQLDAHSPAQSRSHSPAHSHSHSDSSFNFAPASPRSQHEQDSVSHEHDSNADSPLQHAHSRQQSDDTDTHNQSSDHHLDQSFPGDVSATNNSAAPLLSPEFSSPSFIRLHLPTTSQTQTNATTHGDGDGDGNGDDHAAALTVTSDDSTSNATGQRSLDAIHTESIRDYPTHARHHSLSVPSYKHHAELSHSSSSQTSSSVTFHRTSGPLSPTKPHDPDSTSTAGSAV